MATPNRLKGTDSLLAAACRARESGNGFELAITTRLPLAGNLKLKNFPNTSL